MFKKVLIANRGEIAARVIRTCQKLGISTVAVYSEADAKAPFVKMADEAYLIGNSHVNESYLNIDKIISVARESNSDAIHPGYGLLSENANFANKCRDEEIVFIGPSPEVIAKMGSKIEARKAMEKAGIPVVPGITYSLVDSQEAIKVANQMGYPIMLKASAGGGGIGMQIVRNDQDLIRAFSGNQQRATSFFGDGSMYLEKYIENPRHIEIQILADKEGETLYLWERDCSIQRRHQKVIEETPSIFLDEKTRISMCETAVKAAKSIGYENAGTIEFLVDEEKNYYFLEMNTRLQVEHPVTEEVTGLDLVEEQLNIAFGYHISYQQEDVKRSGHAIEVRIYAEDPIKFFPSPGTITKLKCLKGEGIRHELAVEEGSVVSTFYDPMIAKLIIYADNRDLAIKQLADTLESYEVEGIKTNIPMLLKVINLEAFQNGDTTTNFVEKHLK